MKKKKNYDYKSDMKDYYKSDDIAEEYIQKYNEHGSWRGQVIANRERHAVASLLSSINYSKVLDIPTGTGKLAPIFAQTDASVLACDISKNMLQVAKQQYEQAGHINVNFQIHDAENLSEINDRFDVAICLRLLHRVPRDVKRSILHELSAVAKFVIVSTAIESFFHKGRRHIREILMGGDEREHCYENQKETLKILTAEFKIIKSKSVLPLLSQEHVFLLRPLNE